MISTFIGAANFDHGVLSIEPNSRNLIIYADDSPQDTISVRGPYTIDTAIENESNQIRMPSDAMMTLDVGVNDTIKLGDTIYKINETRFGEPDILRLPIEVKKLLHVKNGEVIQNSRLKDVFDGSLITHAYEYNNTTIKEKYFILSNEKQSSKYEICLDNESIVSSYGCFKNNGTYDIFLDGSYVTSFDYEDNLTKSFEYGRHNITMVFSDTNSTSIKQFISGNQGNFLNFNFKK